MKDKKIRLIEKGGGGELNQREGERGTVHKDLQSMYKHLP